MRSKNLLFGLLIVGILVLLRVPARAVTVYNVDLTTQANFGNLNQHDTACGNFACGPTAAVNSFVFLQDKYPDIYDSSLIPHIDGNSEYEDFVSTANALSDPNYMNCAACNGGTLITDFISGKKKWIEDHVPGKTVYMDSPQSNWPFLYNELNDMEDVELLVGFYDAAGNRIGGHYVTLTKFQWTDTNMDNIIQPGENAMIGFVDPDDGTIKMQSLASQMVAGQYNLTTNYGVGGTIGTTAVATTGINWAVSESPIIPEPATIMLVITAAFGVGAYGRPRRAA
jgi:hypothetical protein